MKIVGPKKLVKRAVSAAVALDIYDFELQIKWGKNSWARQDIDNPKVFDMKVCRNLSKFELTEAVSHEMVHIHQYLRGDLQDSLEDGMTIWQGEKYPTDPLGSDGYFLAPWEIEARGLQEWLGYKWEARNRELH